MDIFDIEQSRMLIACISSLLSYASHKVNDEHIRYFIKDGKVSESGTHDQLLAHRGDYYEHVQLQTLSKR